MKRSTWLPLVVLAVITVVSSLILLANRTEIPAAQDVTGKWTLVSGTDGGGVVDATGVNVTMELTSTTLSVKVCNSGGGDYSLNGSTFSVGQFASTMMYCSNPVGIMDIETRLFSIIEKSTTLTIDGENLVMTGLQTQLLFEPTR